MIRLDLRAHRRCNKYRTFTLKKKKIKSTHIKMQYVFSPISTIYLSLRRQKQLTFESYVEPRLSLFLNIIFQI